MSDIALEPSKKKSRRMEVVVGDAKFFFRRLSFRQFRDAASVYDGLQNSQSAAEALDTICKIIVPNLIGWENVEDFDGNSVPFDPQRFEDVVDLDEAKELLRRLMGGGVTEGDVKNSTLPPR